MNDISISSILISVASSIVAGLLLTKYLKFRERQIRAKIEEINTHEEYLEKLSKGNTKLLRSSFTLLFVMLAGLCVAFSSALIALYLSDDSALYPYLIGFSIWLLLTGASLCVFQVRAILHSADLKSARKTLNEKRVKLEKKIT